MPTRRGFLVGFSRISVGPSFDHSNDMVNGQVVNRSLAISYIDQLHRKRLPCCIEFQPSVFLDAERTITDLAKIASLRPKSPNGDLHETPLKSGFFRPPRLMRCIENRFLSGRTASLLFLNNILIDFSFHSNSNLFLI